MHPEKCEVYRHSGKFGVHGPLLAFFASIPVALLLGLAYSYLIKWIPFIYINFFITVGYGLAFGFGVGFLMKICKVRNGTIALLTGLAVGLIALYFEWSGHILALLPKSDKVPWVLWPGQIIEVMKLLYQEGTWGLRSGGPVTGIPLAIVWFLEAGIILSIATLLPWSMISDTPFCEENGCWLDEEKKIDTLQPILNPEIIEQLQAGNLAVLAGIPAKVPGASDFTRLIVKHADDRGSFFTIRLENVITETDKEGKEVEKTHRLTDNLVLPSSMSEFIRQIEKVRQPGPNLQS